jgi:CO/xanthine dehydrogenase FAD-binding subunit
MIREFYQPDTLTKALQLKRDCEGASLLAGGTDLVVSMHNGWAPEGSLIDLSKLHELKGICVENEHIAIGPMTSFTEIADSEILKVKANALFEAAKMVGSPQIRNRATIGGNLCNASAAADGLTPLLCLDAKIELKSLTGNGAINLRVLPLEDFLIKNNQTAIKSNEIVTGIILKLPPAGTFSSFKKIGRRNALAIARLNGCCLINLNDNLVGNIRFALGAATSKPERIGVVEEFLTGKELTGEVLTEAGKLAAEYVQKLTGTRASSNYKLPVIEKFAVSIFRTALGMEE